MNNQEQKDFIKPTPEVKFFIEQMIFQYLSQDPSATKDFIETITKGIEQYAFNQRATYSTLNNYLVDILDKNHKNLKDGALYSIGHIVHNILPSWEGAGISKSLKEKYKVQLAAEQEEIKKRELEAKKEKKLNYSSPKVKYPAPKA